MKPRTELVNSHGKRCTPRGLDPAFRAYTDRGMNALVLRLMKRANRLRHERARLALTIALAEVARRRAYTLGCREP